MKLLIAGTILSLYTLVPASGQSQIVGTWESNMDDEFSDELYVWQFREDGILLQNEYYDGDLECIYAFEYTTRGEVVTIGAGLNWEYDSFSEEFVPYEDFADENVEIAFDFVTAGGKLTLSFTNESLVQGIVEGMRADEEIELDPADLGLDYDFEDEDLVISDEEVIDALLENLHIQPRGFLRSGYGGGVDPGSRWGPGECPEHTGDRHVQDSVGGDPGDRSRRS